MKSIRQWAILLGCALTAAAARAEPVTSTPLQMCGLGTLLCGVMTPDGQYALTGGGGGAFLWEKSTGKSVRMFTGHGGWVNRVAFSPDGTKFVTAGGVDRTAKLWSTATGAELRTFTGHANSVWGVAYSADGTRIVTGCHDGTAKLWNASTGQVIRTFGTHGGLVREVAISPNGQQIATASYDWTVAVWNVSDGSLAAYIWAHNGEVESVAFSPGGTRIATSGADGVARIWDIATATQVQVFAGHTADVPSVVFSPGGSLLATAGWDGTAKLWDVATGNLIRTFTGHTSGVLTVAFSKDGTRLLTTSLDGTARLWNVGTGALVQTFSGFTGPVAAVAFSPDGTKVLSGGGWDTRATLWNTANGIEIRRFFGHGYLVNSVAYSKDGTRILTGSWDGRAKLWNPETGGLVRTFYDPAADYVMAVSFSPTGTEILTAHESFANLWTVATGDNPHWYWYDGEWVRAVAFSPNGLKVLTGGDNKKAILWDKTTEDVLQVYDGHTSIVRAVAFSPDGTKVLTGSLDKTAKLWNTTNNTCIRTFTGHTGAVVSVAFSPDGTKILTGSYDRKAKLWNMSTGVCLRTFAGHSDWVNSVAFSSDGTKMATASGDGTVKIWPLSAAPTTPTAVNTGDKVILVAGGGNFVGNPIGPQTQALADRAFFTCLVRGYSHTDVQFLSAFPDWQTRDSNNDGRPDADAQATAAAFWSAVDTWAQGAARVFIYMIDHGTYNSQTNDYFFRINPTEYIRAKDLDTHLDALQAKTGCEVILIVDCCFSGGFLQQCRAASGVKRIVITSTTEKNPAVYSPPAGAESFSFYFFSYAILGNTLDNCYKWTRLSFTTMGNPAGQTPWMDDNNDGVSNKNDGALAARHVFGRYPAFGLNAPLILSVATTQTVASGKTATLWARLDAAVAAKSVWAVVIPRNVEYASGQPVTSLTRVNLAWNAGQNRWQAAFQPDLRHVSLCTVTYFAESEDTLGTRLIATPMSSGLRVAMTSADRAWWLYE
ncbi:MAG: WD40 repeat domain-containing protein [Candidatus Sumerlaeia bacterium]|nr:WD40 repeat domain-containing protein [Candidatus Sumerlaeia bacterium]